MSLFAWLLRRRRSARRPEPAHGAPAEAPKPPRPALGRAPSRTESGVSFADSSPSAFSGAVAERLVDALHEEAHQVTDVHDRQYVAGLLRAVRNEGVELPSLPAEVLRLHRLLGTADTSVAELVHAVQRDPAITARFVKIANSGAYARRHKVTSAGEAAVRLGFDQSAVVVMAVVSSAKLFKVHGFKQETAALSRHSLATATAAQLLARASAGPERDAFLLGLTHDVGKIFMLSVASQLFRESRGQWAAQPATIERLIRDLHPAFGALAAEAWGFDPTLVQAIAQHHVFARDPAAADHLPEEVQAVAALVAAADMIAHLLLEPERPAAPELAPTLARLGLVFSEALGAQAMEAFRTFDRERADTLPEPERAAALR
jgi:HD-like signal output (HDOD) protein